MKVKGTELNSTVSARMDTILGVLKIIRPWTSAKLRNMNLKQQLKFEFGTAGLP